MPLKLEKSLKFNGIDDGFLPCVGQVFLKFESKAHQMQIKLNSSFVFILYLYNADLN